MDQRFGSDDLLECRGHRCRPWRGRAANRGRYYYGGLDRRGRKDVVLYHRLERAVHAAIRHVELRAFLGDVDGHERDGPAEHVPGAANHTSSTLGPQSR